MDEITPLSDVTSMLEEAVRKNDERKCIRMLQHPRQKEITAILKERGLHLWEIAKKKPRSRLVEFLTNILLQIAVDEEDYAAANILALPHRGRSSRRSIGIIHKAGILADTTSSLMNAIKGNDIEKVKEIMPREHPIQSTTRHLLKERGLLLRAMAIQRGHVAVAQFIEDHLLLSAVDEGDTVFIWQIVPKPSWFPPFAHNLMPLLERADNLVDDVLASVAIAFGNIEIMSLLVNLHCPKKIEEDLLKKFGSLFEEVVRRGDIEQVARFVGPGKTHCVKLVKERGLALMAIALEEGHVDLFRYLGKTMVIVALDSGDVVTVKKLILMTPNLIRVRDDDDMSLLLIAVQKGFLEVARWLVQQEPALLQEENFRFMALHFVVENCDYDMACWLIQVEPKLLATVKEEAALMKRWQDESTPAIIDAAKHGCEELVKLFVKVRPELLVDRRYYGQTLLHAAAEGGNLNLVQWIVQKRPSLLNIEDTDDGNMAIHEAIRCGRIEVVKFLFRQQSWQIAEKAARTALRHAITARQFDIVRWLCKEQPKLLMSEGGRTALLLAIKMGVLDTVKWLSLQQPRLLSDIPTRALLNAATQVHGIWRFETQIYVAEWLVKERPDALWQKGDDITKLIQQSRAYCNRHRKPCGRHLDVINQMDVMCAAYQDVFQSAILGNVDKIQQIMEDFPFMANATNGDGQTILHVASSSGHVQAVRYLIDFEPTPLNALDGNGINPKEAAQMNGEITAVNEINDWFYGQPIIDELSLFRQMTTTMNGLRREHIRDLSFREMESWIRQIGGKLKRTKRDRQQELEHYFATKPAGYVEYPKKSPCQSSAISKKRKGCLTQEHPCQSIIVSKKRRAQANTAAVAGLDPLSTSNKGLRREDILTLSYADMAPWLRRIGKSLHNTKLLRQDELTKYFDARPEGHILYYH